MMILSVPIFFLTNGGFPFNLSVSICQVFCFSLWNDWAALYVGTTPLFLLAVEIRFGRREGEI